MQRLTTIIIAAGLCAGATGQATAAGCGLNVNPAAMDTDHNAELSRAETRGSVLAGVFDRVDYNHDGVISQPEYENRCNSLRASSNAGWNKGWQDTAAGRRVEQQRQRQSNRVNDRVNRESNRAADSAVDKVMGALFGR